MEIELSSARRIANGRCVRPEDTVQRLESALSEVCRFSYREERISDSLYRGSVITDALAFPPMGKGATSLACRISALAEAVEWLSLKRRRQLAGYSIANQDDLDAAVTIDELLAHIATADAETLAGIKRLDVARHWVDGYSIKEKRPRKVPLEYVHAIAGTNGLAAGNCLEEAVVQGTNEVFERRAAITVIRERMIVPSYDLESIRNKRIRDQIEYIRSNETDVVIKDLSFGGVLPCVGVYFRDRKIPEELQSHHVFKAAASFDRDAALMSCLTEYGQILERGRGDESSLHEYERLLCEEDADNFLPLFWFGYIPYQQADFIEEGDVVAFDSGELPGDCLEDISRAGEIFEELGKDYVIVDLTDPSVGFPVVQVVVPGYSDILPYHPVSSPVLFEGWTRELSMGRCRNGAGASTPCTVSGFFPEW